MVNAGTSKRDYLLPMGDPEEPSVAYSNLMASRPRFETNNPSYICLGLIWGILGSPFQSSPVRTSLLLLLITAAGSVWLLENPGSSVVMQHDHMQNLIRLLRRVGLNVYKQTFWMAHYNHPNMKLTKIWSCSYNIWRLDFGKLPQCKNQQVRMSTTRKYINSKGEQRFTATAALKKSQCFDRA